MKQIHFPQLSDISDISDIPNITNMEEISLFNLSDEPLDEPLEPSHNDWIIDYIYEDRDNNDRVLRMGEIIFRSLEILYVVRDWRGFSNDNNEKDITPMKI